MSGDVQPRKRKDKKKKKDELGIEEPRGTAAALGEGDVFMHSHHEHGTGGHWCAKVIFFSLLAVLVTLIGLIILENRGLSELEANSVESRYSGVLEGWLEDGHDDDHHDEHTLELKHHDNEDHDDHNEDDSDVELEHIEEEVFDDFSTKSRPRRSEDSEEISKEAAPVNDADDDDVELLELDELDELPEELPIPVPKGKPLVEVEEKSSTEKPQDTLADEEEYERQQEALRKEKEQASQGMWLKLVVGGALLVATQAVLRRATAPRENEDEVNTTREETPLSDRRMTLITEPVPPPVVTPNPQEVSRPVIQKEAVSQAPVEEYASTPVDDDEEEIIVTKDIKQIAAQKDTVNRELYSDEEDEEEEFEEEEEVEEKEEPPKPIAKPAAPIKEPPKTLKPTETKEPPTIEKEPTPEDDDVEIIEDEDIDEDLEEEEEEISDVDDAELLTRLEAKYGRLPEPERPYRKKDSGNSVEDEWPGEPSDAYWRDELDGAERDLRQDWLD